MKKGAVFVSTDISSKMIDLFVKKIESSELVESKSVKFHKLKSWKGVEPEKGIKNI